MKQNVHWEAHCAVNRVQQFNSKDFVNKRLVLSILTSFIFLLSKSQHQKNRGSPDK